MSRNELPSLHARHLGAGKLPKYALHRPSGRAVVYLDRRPVYLGKHGSAESYERFWQLVAERCTPAQRRIPVLVTGDEISVAVLVERYLAYAVGYYGSNNEYLSTRVRSRFACFHC
jgi:hypothetical protein